MYVPMKIAGRSYFLLSEQPGQYQLLDTNMKTVATGKTPKAAIAAMIKSENNKRMVKMEDLPEDLQPINRLFYAGPGALSDSEILACVLQQGTQAENPIRFAERLLADFGGFWGLAQISAEELTQVYGISKARAARIKATVEIARRLPMVASEPRPQIRSHTDAANLVMVEMGLLETEQLRVILLDTKNYVKQVVTLYAGSLNTAVVRIAEVFRDAIRQNSASMIIVHNHPSGDPTPSPEDVRVTEMIVSAGVLLDIDVLDHIVIGRNRFVSMKERGLGFNT